MNNRQRFLAANPTCIFCGGLASATTVEHCPPRALFQHKHWPEGFEFAACGECNHGTGDQDAIVSMLARMDPNDATGDSDGRVLGLIKNVGNQFPEMIPKMMPSAVEARRKNRELGIKPGPGQTHQDVAPVLIPIEISLAVEAFSRKLAKAIYFREVDAIFPSEGTLLLNWFTNAELVQHGRYLLFDLLRDVPGRAVPLRRGGKYLDEQFQYKLSITQENNVFILQARFGVAFGLVIFGSTQPGIIEPVLEQLRTKYSKDGPFITIQSAAASAA
jgi:hypothetical protein